VLDVLDVLEVLDVLDVLDVLGEFGTTGTPLQLWDRVAWAGASPAGLRHRWRLYPVGSVADDQVVMADETHTKLPVAQPGV
jgi:hypothetical protein